MKFSSPLIISATLLATVSATPFKRGVDPDLVPGFGHQAGLNRTAINDDCDGIPDAFGVPIKVPCFCPPDRDAFITALNENVDAGHAVNNTAVLVSFPTDDSKESKLARIFTVLVTLQNLRGSGVGCPASSTTFVALQKSIQDETVTSTPPAPTPTPPEYPNDLGEGR